MAPHPDLRRLHVLRRAEARGWWARRSNKPCNWMAFEACVCVCVCARARACAYCGAVCAACHPTLPIWGFFCTTGVVAVLLLLGGHVAPVVPDLAWPVEKGKGRVGKRYLEAQYHVLPATAPMTTLLMPGTTVDDT